MASSAVIAPRNESSWGQSVGGFMGKKLAYTNLNPNFTNPNPNFPPTNRKQPTKTKTSTTKEKKPIQSLHNSPIKQTTSDDAYSNNISASRDTINDLRYYEVKLLGYSRKEIVELRKKLELELQEVRVLSNRIESGQISGQKRKNMKNGVLVEDLMKLCRQILMKLMKHKHSWVFNKPVDAVALGLHDYHQIVRRPMDLGTVKANLGKGVYGSSPREFAEDVRLTFGNAMLYNPKTDEVHSMASQLLSEFESKFKMVEDKLLAVEEEESNDVFVGKREFSGIEKRGMSGVVGGDDEVQGSLWNEVSTPPERLKKAKTELVGSIQKNVVEEVDNEIHQPSVSNTVRTPSPKLAQPVKPMGMVKGERPGKLPKPRAKDPIKREMSMEEKQKLGVGLQNLPEEKMPQLVQIIRKRNEQLAQEGDEIELDIEALDTETLWELDRFVTNWTKLDSKTRRQALMGNNVAAPSATSDTDSEAPVSYRNDGEKKVKKGDVEEDIDIDDEMPESSFPPVEIEKDDGEHPRDNGTSNLNGNASDSSCSSGSSSSESSSSDSDSGSSSGSDSEADEAQS